MSPVTYQVSYSGRVRDALQDLMIRARAVGLDGVVLAATREIDHRLHICPQFGQPLRDLHTKPAQLWIGTVPPLTVQYILDEASRQVMVVLPLRPLRGSGL